jgi:uncharacterized protein
MRILCRALAPAMGVALELGGCGRPPAPVPPAPLVVRTEHYAPLGMAADAKLPGQAVILGTDEANGSTVLPLPTTPRTAVVDAMVVTPGGSGPASGRMIAVTLTTAPAVATPPAVAASPNAAATGDALQVGPSEPSDAGWRHGLWRAAFVAATALGKDLHDVAFQAVPASPAGGAAAAALLAGGFLATMTGAKIDPAATLAGSLAPDGTIGPVAGIPEQFERALAHGKTRLGYPSGMRFARSQATGKDVDLVQLARDHHAEAVELATVSDAYQLLTHTALPSPLPVSEADMALDPDTLTRLGVQYLAWQKRLADEWTQLLHLEQAGRLPATLGLIVRFAREKSEQAETLYRAGKLPAAYSRMLTAWLYAAGASHTYAVLTKLQAGDPDGARAALAALDPTDPGPGAIFTRLGARRPATLGGHLAMLAAFQAALRGASSHGSAGDALREAAQFLTSWTGKPAAELGAPSTADAVANRVVPAVLMMLRTIVETTVAEQAQAFEHDEGVPYACPPQVTRLAAVFQAEAAADLRYVDTLLIEPLARSAGITVDLVRRRVASVEPDYLLAETLARDPAGSLPRELTASWGEGSAACRLVTLAGAMVASHSAALLIAKYDALAIHIADSGRVDAVDHPEAFRDLLANAKRQARASARAARIATGAIPVQAKLAYQLAGVEAAGSLDDQLDALAELWTASAFCQVAVMLARA